MDQRTRRIYLKFDIKQDYKRKGGTWVRKADKPFDRYAPLVPTHDRLMIVDNGNNVNCG